MSNLGKKVRRTQHERKRNAPATVQAARAFLQSTTQSAADLTTSQLEQVLLQMGASVSDLKPLMVKSALVKQVESRIGSRVTAATNDRARQTDSDSTTKPVFPFLRLPTSLVVEIAGFLDLVSVARWAIGHRWLRVRLSLSLDGTASPALAALRVFVARQVCGQRILNGLVYRASRLQHLDLRASQEVPSTLPPSLHFLRLSINNKSQWLRCVRSIPDCDRLRVLYLDTFAARRSISDHMLRLPALEALHLQHGDLESFDFFSKCVNSLRALHLHDGHTSLTVLLRLVRSCLQLRTLHLVRFRVMSGSMATIDDWPALTDLHVSDDTLLPFISYSWPSSVRNLGFNGAALQFLSSVACSSIQHATVYTMRPYEIPHLAQFHQTETLVVKQTDQLLFHVLARCLMATEVMPRLSYLKMEHRFMPPSNSNNICKCADTDALICDLLKKQRPQLRVEVVAGARV